MFRINKLTDYAVVLLVDMARSDRVRAAHQIAADTGVPVPTVAKVMKALVRSGLVRSTRGAAGGYLLARPAERIAVADMIQALEGPIALTACVEDADETCDRETFCPMAGHWNRVNAAVRRALEGITLADMAAEPASPHWSTTAPASRAAGGGEAGERRVSMASS
ncbi:SUF system Fe-S cluster assembly regulator [Roseospira goensis]|uniref:FeS assembly SUF system regulator n=1 Tax=Roseospira goensis TaxID=391922 RepID=A0A7W6S0P0_9PROT|nr:SUF system Fe-S cluster assembly regulator [Roseospira goensis]MBB4286730.1 FeS assembly SUF system regulator [Roseospira goensis]